MKRLVKYFAAVSAAFCAVAFGMIGYAESKLPEAYTVSRVENIQPNCALPVSFTVIGKQAEKANGSSQKISCSVQFKLFGVFPVKKADVTLAENREVSVLGTPFGVKLYTDGVMVVKLGSFKSNGNSIEPARLGGIKCGDYIISLNGINIYTNSEVERIVNSSGGKAICVKYSRLNKEKTAYVIPQISDSDGRYHIGMWVRDSSAGIGTLTFYDEQTNVTAGLGHGLCDADTDALVSVKHGTLLLSDIISVTKSKNGYAGELSGCFTNKVVSSALTNTECGIYAVGEPKCEVYKKMQVLPKGEVSVGDAEILTTIDGMSPKLYKCRIEKVMQNGKTRNFIVEITDKRLLCETGGIVQGQSGSPIIQNGKLAGALTHVFVDQCSKGYGIFAENMLNRAEIAAGECSNSESSVKKAS